MEKFETTDNFSLCISKTQFNLCEISLAKVRRRKGSNE